jgi:heptosyltransferase-2
MNAGGDTMSDLRVLLCLPTWLGDSVMCTPALDNLRRQLPGAKLVAVSSPGAAQLFTGDPRLHAIVLDKTKSQGLRWRTVPRLGRQLREEYGPFDLAFTFKNSFAARWLLRAAGAPCRIGGKIGWSDLLLTDAIPCASGQHYAQWYNQIVNGYFGSRHEAGPLTLHVPASACFVRPAVGLAPGSAYGSARRWDAERFGQVAVALSRDFDVLILGGPQEREQGDVIEAALRQAGVADYRNLIGQSVAEMIATMAGMKLYIGHDSGATHIAAALGVPTVAIYGSTSPALAYPWRHPASRIVRHYVACAPCNRRTCPLQHHACMQEITVGQVLDAAYSLGTTNALPCSFSGRARGEKSARRAASDW